MSKYFVWENKPSVAQTEILRRQQLTASFMPTEETLRQIGCVINGRTHTTKSILIRIWVRRTVSGKKKTMYIACKWQKNELLHGTWGLMPFLNFSLVVSAQ